VLKQLYATMPAGVFCRSDPRFANVIKRPDGRYGFVDWEDAGLRDPALEAADLMLHPEQEDLLTPAEWQPFLTAYCQATGFVQAGFLQRVEQYALALPLFWILVMMQYGIRLGQAGKLAEWQINELPANLRLQRYLARALAGTQRDFDPGAVAEILFFPTS
jgi:thiamine kinase-like enzyme